MSVSVIIPTLNSAQYLPAVFDSLDQQTLAPTEVIVVDNHSVDATCDIARKRGARVISAGPERSAQLNAAIEAAKGDFIYRVDADFVVGKDVLCECVAICTSGGCDAVAVHNDSTDELGFWSRVRAFERRMYRNDDLVVAARFFKADAIRAVGGFDERLSSAEDYDVHNKLLAAGYKIGRSNSGEIHLGEPRSLSEIWSKNLYYGRFMARYIKRYPARSALQLHPFRPAFFRNWREFLKDPLMGLALVVMLIVRYLAGACGLVLSIMESGRS